MNHFSCLEWFNPWNRYRPIRSITLYMSFFLFFCLCITQFQLRPAPTPTPPLPRLLRGICPLCQSRAWGICKFCAARGPGICQPQGQPRAFDTHAVSYHNITTERILLEIQADWLIVQGREKTEEVCRGIFSILCTHFFIAYQTRIT